MTDPQARLLRLTADQVMTLDSQGCILAVKHLTEDKEILDTSDQGRHWQTVYQPVRSEATVPGPPAAGLTYLTQSLDRYIQWQFIPTQGPDTLQGPEPRQGENLRDEAWIGAGRDVTQRISTEQHLMQEKEQALGKNREIKCLYGIASLLDSNSLKLEQKLDSLISLVPQAFQHPHKTGARLTFDLHTHEAGPCPSDPATLSEPILVEDRQRGSLDIFTRDRAVSRQEKQLLKTAARQISLALEKEERGDRHTELTQQLHHADRLATVGQLAAGIAHELNGPLNNILGYAQLAAKQEDLPEQVYTDLDHIIRFSLHTREIVKKIMLFSRQTPPKQQQVNLNQIIEESLYFTDPLCKKSGITIECRPAEDLPDMTADPSQLHQVMVNLIVNAAQAMTPSGGIIRIETGRKTRDQLFLTVADNGRGMDEHTLSQCFLPFFTTKDVDQGTGLGLSVVHGIVEAHGGTITADSTPGQGSRFTLIFPRQGGAHV